MQHPNDEYPDRRLLETDLDPNPFAQFERWWNEAIQAKLPEPSAMTLATADADGRPSARMVLLRGFDERGFAFFTNYRSRKATELTANPRAALVCFWPELERQIRIEGRVEKTAEEESDRYFQSRPRDSQLGAWASPQSEIIPDRKALEETFEVEANRFDGQPVPRPPHWGGFRVIPDSIEFWQGGPHRLHDRLRYVRIDKAWRIERLGP